MDTSTALSAFSALGQETRLAVLRLLLRQGAAGQTAGEIAEALDVRQNTLSANLAVLARAGLVHSRREGRSIRYFADIAGVRGLLDFLVEDCCNGHPDLCLPPPRDTP